MDWQYLFTSMDGRIGRKSFWIGVLVFFVVGIIASIIDALLNTPRFGGSGVVGVIADLVMIYPSIALSAKRWHDRGKSAWWILINIIPVIGWIWALVETGFLKGTTGANQYGPDPLLVGAAATA
ncbi:MAG TPA: DUF805 domain-containing protein [Devosia sp.]|nr:DUF805 domain-containing protein [Devosia sp.]